LSRNKRGEEKKKEVDERNEEVYWHWLDQEKKEGQATDLGGGRMKAESLWQT
jgi:hypothetical protein